MSDTMLSEVLGRCKKGCLRFKNIFKDLERFWRVRK